MFDVSFAVLVSFGYWFGIVLLGGGFWVLFFYFGVFVVLVEWDLLWLLEVIFCVLGGLILGVAYYSALVDELECMFDVVIFLEIMVGVLLVCIDIVIVVVMGTNICMWVFFLLLLFWCGWCSYKGSRTWRGGMFYEELFYKWLCFGGWFDFFIGLCIVLKDAAE